jgi:hypothetical protein
MLLARFFRFGDGVFGGANATAFGKMGRAGAPPPSATAKAVRGWFARLACETPENWLVAIRYLNMEHRREPKKEALRALAA